MLLKKNTQEARKTNTGSGKMQLAQHSEEIRQSLDVLDRVLSEFDDIETDTNDDSVVPDINDAIDVTDAADYDDDDDEGGEGPPPIDRSLKPRIPGGPPPPDLPRKTRLTTRPGSGSSSPSSHEYQEINSDMGLPPQRSPEHPVPPPAPLTPPGGLGVRRQMSEDRARLRRQEEDGRRQPRRQRSEDTRLRRDDISSSSGDLMTLDVRDINGKLHPMRDSSRGRSRDGHRDGRDAGREGRESRHLRKSRSGDVDARRVPNQDQGHRRRSRSSDRWLDHNQQHHPHEQLMMEQQRRMEAAGVMVDPRLVDPSMIDPRMIDPRLVDPRMIDPRLIDPRYMDEPYPMIQDPIRFPHLMSYPPMAHAGPMSPGSMSPGAMSPIPPGHPMGPPLMPMDYAPYPMYPYDLGGYIPDPMLGPEMAFMPPPHHPAFPGDIPPEFIHPSEFLPPDYPMDYPLEYGPPPRNPAMMGGAWVAPDGVHPREDWPPPTPEQAQKLIQRVVRNPSRSSGDDDVNEEGAASGQVQQMRRFGRRLTSIGHSDSSGLSSPSEERRPFNGNNSSNRKVSGGFRGVNPSFREASATTPPSEFRVGEAVRESSDRVPMKNSASLPHFSSGKDSGFDEAQVVTEDGSNGANRGGRPSGGAFIVSGVFNDSSRMFIPAPPSPTPDYDDEGDGDSDGNESDILQGSQFYVAGSQGYPVKKKLANRDSLSDDSLQNAPVVGSKAAKQSTPLKAPSTPLQTMMKEFHQGLPPPDNENGFSDDSLEDSTVGPLGPSLMSPKPQRQNSMESLASMESSTASFDYINEGQVTNSSYERPKTRPAPGAPGTGNNGGIRGGHARDRKDLNGKVKKSLSRSTENGLAQRSKENEKRKGDSNSFSRQSSRESSNSSGSNGSKPGEKFDDIRTMLKEGLIEGLDESPPKFKPPPPSKKTPNDERADSGLGSIVSTTRTDESGGSDNRSDFSGTPPSLTSPRDVENAKNNRVETKKGKETVRSRSSIASEDMERNRDEGDEVEVTVQETMEVPPPPPPRDESMHWTPRTNPPRDHSRISLRATPTIPAPLAHRDISRSSLRSAPSTPSTSKNTSWLHNTTTSGKEEILEVTSNYSHYSTGDKITHVDDLYGQNEQFGSGSEVSSAINGSLASHYSIQDSDNPLTDREFLENLKNLEPRPRPDTLAVISEDQGSIGSKGSRSGRLLSRIADSVRSGSRTPTPNSSLSSNTRATTTKLTSTSRASTRIHGDIIREPWRSSLRESALPSPQEYSRLPSLSPSMIPLTRDGSGRFRSIEDLAEAVSAPTHQEVTLSGKRKKHSTLPPNLTPADMKKENKELRRATSLMVGKKGKESGEGSKFRFNFFRGFWRRKQYSFDNKV